MYLVLLALALPKFITLSSEEERFHSIREGNPSLTQAMLVHGANVNTTNIEDLTALIVAMDCQVNKTIVKQLLDYGADPNTKMNSSGRTLLMNAEGWGLDEEIRLLAQFGAKVNAQDKEGRTALMYAVEKGREENVSALLTCHADVGLYNKENKTVLEIAETHLADNTTTSFLHIETEERRKVWKHIVRLLRKYSKRP